MIRISHKTSGEIQNVSSLAGYSDEWEQVGPPMPAGSNPLEIELVDGEWKADLPLLRTRRWAAIRATRNVAQSAGCATPLGRVDTDVDSRGKISGAVQMAMIAQMAGQPFSIEWTMQDNSVVEHDAPAMIALGIAVGQHVEACHAEGTARRMRLDAAQDEAAIEAVPVESGWPGE